MVSIAQQLDEFDIAQEIRLERQVHKGSFLVLKGNTDIKRFERFVDEIECSLVNAYFRSNAIKAIEMLYDEGFPGAVAVVDADFDRMTGNMIDHEGIIYSDNHDLDLDWINPRILDRYLIEVADPEKLQRIGNSADVLQKVKVAIKPLSVLRYLNDRGIVRYRLKDLRIDQFCEGFLCDYNKLVKAVFEGRGKTLEQENELANLIRENATKQYDMDQLTNGHDLCAALGVVLRSELGTEKFLKHGEVR